MKYPHRSQKSLHFRSLNRTLHTGQNNIGSLCEKSRVSSTASWF